MSHSPIPRLKKTNSDVGASRERSFLESKNADEKVNIFVRIRPTLNQESDENFVEKIDETTLRIFRPGNEMLMKFNNIFDPATTQKKTFESTKDAVFNFLEGQNSTIFAYGQTGAGKTFTIIGDTPNEQVFEEYVEHFQRPERGILPRSLHLIMENLKKNANKCEYNLFVSFFEIYNDKVFDLLNDKKYKNGVGLEIREGKNGDIQIPDLSYAMIETIEDAFEYLIIGLKNREIGCTYANSKSSRSHSVFQLTLSQQKSKKDPKIISSLKIVDLAGSEKFCIPPEVSAEEREIRIQELTSINGSLSTLGMCISAMTDKSRKHVPFRNSKLTRVLSDSLSGNGKIWFIVCITPSLDSSAETFSTLQFAHRAKKAILDGRSTKYKMLKPEKCSQVSELKELKIALDKERYLREEYEKLLKKDASASSIHEQYMKLQKENEILKEQIKHYEETEPRRGSITGPALIPLQPLQGRGSPLASGPKASLSEKKQATTLHKRSTSTFLTSTTNETSEDTSIEEMNTNNIPLLKSFQQNMALGIKEWPFSLENIKKSLSKKDCSVIQCQSNEELDPLSPKFNDHSSGTKEIAFEDDSLNRNLEKAKVLERLKQKKIEKKMEDFFCSGSPTHFSSGSAAADSITEEHILPVNTILKEKKNPVNKPAGEPLVLSPSRDYLNQEKENYSDPLRINSEFVEKKKQAVPEKALEPNSETKYYENFSTFQKGQSAEDPRARNRFFEEDDELILSTSTINSLDTRGIGILNSSGVTAFLDSSIQSQPQMLQKSNPTKQGIQLQQNQAPQAFKAKPEEVYSYRETKMGAAGNIVNDAHKPKIPSTMWRKSESFKNSPIENQIKSKSFNISNLVADLEEDLGKALSQLKDLKQQDEEIRVV